MAQTTELEIKIQSRNNRDLPVTTGKITQIHYDQAERTRNALKTFGVLIGLTFASVFVPLLHYFLVPLLLIASFVFAIDKMNETTRSLGGEGQCPKCHAVLQIVASKFTERMTDSCAQCHEDVEIKIV